jgi:hypothetical protein
VLPIEQQDKGIPEYYGFTPSNIGRNMWTGFKGTIAGVGSAVKDLASNPNWVFGENSTLQKFVADPMHQEAAKAVAAYQKRNYSEAFGHAVASGLPVAGPMAAQLGEQAGTGDVGGAVGQAAGMAGAADVMNAAATGLRAGGRFAAENAPAAVEAAKNVTPKQAAQAVGGVGGGVAGHGTLSAPGAYYGAKSAGGLVENLLGKERANAPIFNRTSPPTNPGAPYPTATPEQLNPALVSPARTLPGQVAPERIAPEQPIPGVTSRPFIERVQPDRGLLLTGDSPESALGRLRNLIVPERGVDPGIRPSIERITDEPSTSPQSAKARLEELLNEGLGGKPLEQGVALKNQGVKLPQGFTPVESSALKGYRYNPESSEFQAISQNGQHYIYGDVSPEQAADFEAADSKGTAWNNLRKAPGVTLTAKVINGKRVAVARAGQSAAP